MEDKKYTEEDKAQMIKILKENNIEMCVSGCGCCGSPGVTFKYKGETIFDDDYADFDTESDNV